MARGRPPKCPYCGSSRNQKKGMRKTRTMGIRQIRLCKNCGRKFTPRYQKKPEIKNKNIEDSELVPGQSYF